MKKVLISLLVITFLLAMGGMAFGYGYRDIPDDGDCGDCHAMMGGAPGLHREYSSTTNRCKICHAVHEAGDPLGTSWKLLRGATGPEEACNYCHIGAAAHTTKVVYDKATDPEDPTSTVNGHTIGVTDPWIPDSKDSGSGGYKVKYLTDNKFVCNGCHSVHGANVLSENMLRKDPAVDPDTGTSPVVLSDAATVRDFCAACHTDNDDSGQSHPFGSADNTIAWVGTNTAGYECRDCHNATGQPHATDTPVTHERMLTARDDADGSSDQAEVSKLDDVCRRCHVNAASDEGVGISF